MCCRGERCLCRMYFFLRTAWYRHPFVFPTCYFLKAATPLLKTAKANCPSCHIHQVISESTWVCESLGCVCLMMSGCEVEWRWEISGVRVGWARELMWLQPLLGSDRSVSTTAEGQGQSKRSNMRELVGHALWQKANGREDGSHVKSAAKLKRNVTGLRN